MQIYFKIARLLMLFQKTVELKLTQKNMTGYNYIIAGKGNVIIVFGQRAQLRIVLDSTSL